MSPSTMFQKCVHRVLFTMFLYQFSIIMSPPSCFLYRVQAGSYTSTSEKMSAGSSTIHKVPLSDITVTSSCLPDGSAVTKCSVKGSDPRYSWSLDGRSISSHSRVTLPPPVSGTLRCDVINQINNLSRSINISCAVPLSDITVTSSCLPDGSAVTKCSVKGSDPRYSWSLDGRSVSSHSRVTLPPPVSGTLRCDVTNQINNLSRSINISCAVPVSDPVLDVRCLQNGSAEISCWVEKGTDPSIYLNVIAELEVYNVTSSERTVRVTVPPVSPPDSWNISCSSMNDISERSTNQTHDACPGESRSGLWSDWSRLLSPIAVFVLYTVLLVFIVNDLRKMKNEKNRSERRMRRTDQMEMEMEPTYYNDRD
ncbi:uncharacterized protein [Aquarana catesbeiana]|uniref:uncharacterized protein n=1 Tax=Aquarana catesbeiana TaxID=8400 RepID=UPI003CCA0DC8